MPKVNVSLGDLRILRRIQETRKQKETLESEIAAKTGAYRRLQEQLATWSEPTASPAPGPRRVGRAAPRATPRRRGRGKTTAAVLDALERSAAPRGLTVRECWEEVAKERPAVSIHSVEMALRRLWAAGRVEKRGRTRPARYRLRRATAEKAAAAP